MWIAASPDDSLPAAGARPETTTERYEDNPIIQISCIINETHCCWIYNMSNVETCLNNSTSSSCHLS